MVMRRTTVTLDSQDLQALKQLAQRDRRTVDEMITLADRNYLAQRPPDLADWQRRWDEAVERIQRHIPADQTPEEIDVEVRAVRATIDTNSVRATG